MSKSTPKIEMYVKFGCSYCASAKRLFEQKGVEFINIPAAMNREKRAEMNKRSGGRNTFPQIFIDGQHIGGCDDLYALDAAGGLDPLLGLSG